MKNRKLLAFLLGLTLVFITAEISLRLWAGFSYRTAETGQQSTGEKFRILCLGNSHTFGAGVSADKAYSHVLESFFRKERPEFPVTVINAGVNNGNSSILVSRFDSFMESGKPDIVLTMTGEPNIWNKTGFTDFLAKKGQRSFDWKTYLSGSRVIRWFLMLPYLKESHDIAAAKEKDVDFAAYEVLARFEESHLNDPRSRAERQKLFSIVEKFLKKHEGKELKTRFIYNYILASLSPDVEKTLFYLEESIRSSQGNPNYFALLMLDLWIPAEKKPDFKNRLIALRKLAAAGRKDEKLLQKEVSLAWDYHVMKAPGPEEIRFLEKVRSNSLYSAMMTTTLARYYMTLKEEQKSVNYLGEFLEWNPLTNADRDTFYLINEMAASELVPSSVRNSAIEARNNYKKRFPSESYRFMRLEENELSDWIISDLSAIGEKVSGLDAVPVFQTYHSIRNRKEGTLVNEAIRKYATKENRLLIDTYQTFDKEIKSRGDVESFFVQGFGVNDNHPSEKGHALIARIIYDFLNNKALLPVELRNLPSRNIYRYSWE